jgi:hypothetical protein
MLTSSPQVAWTISALLHVKYYSDSLSKDEAPSANNRTPEVIVLPKNRDYDEKKFGLTASHRPFSSQLFALHCWVALHVLSVLMMGNLLMDADILLVKVMQGVQWKAIERKKSATQIAGVNLYFFFKNGTFLVASLLLEYVFRVHSLLLLEKGFIMFKMSAACLAVLLTVLTCMAGLCRAQAGVPFFVPFSNSTPVYSITSNCMLLISIHLFFYCIV